MEFPFSTSLVNKTIKQFLAMNGLAAAKTDLINRKAYQVIAVINLEVVKK